MQTTKGKIKKYITIYITPSFLYYKINQIKRKGRQYIKYVFLTIYLFEWWYFNLGKRKFVEKLSTRDIFLFNEIAERERYFPAF